MSKKASTFREEMNCKVPIIVGLLNKSVLKILKVRLYPNENQRVLLT
jgi:hypothetical protein